MRKLFFITALCVNNFACAADIEVLSPWVRGTVEGQQSSGAFMAITSKKNATLVGVSCKLAGNVEVHEMKMEGDRMLMRAVPRVALPAGQAVELSGSYHIMLMDLKQTLKAGQKVPLELKIEGADKKVQTLKVDAEVRDLSAAPASSADSHHHH